MGIQVGNVVNAVDLRGARYFCVCRGICRHRQGNSL